MNKPKNLIIATPNIELAQGLKKQIELKEYKVISIEITIEHLLETIEKNETSNNTVYGIIMTSDIARKLKDKRLEYLSDSLLTIRERHSHIRFILLANEPEGHPFLAEVFSMGIYNIFRKGKDELSVDIFLRYLERPKTFSDASIYRKVTIEVPWRREVETGPRTIVIENKGKTQLEESETNEKKTKIDILSKEKEIKEPVQEEQKVIPVSKHTVGILSLSKKSGSTFLTGSFAKSLAEHGITVSVLENPIESKARTYIFHSLGIASLEKKNSFYSVPHEIMNNQKVDKEKIFKKDDIHWMVVDPRKEGIRKWSFSDMLRYLHSSSTVVTLMDMGWVNMKVGEGIGYMLREFDYLLVCIDPLPQEIEANIESLEHLEEIRKQGTNVIYVINKMNKEVRLNNELGVNIKTEFRLTNKINIKQAIQVPAVPTEFIYKAQFQRKLPYEYEEVKEILEPSMLSLVKMIFPDIKPRKQQLSFFSRFKRN